MSPTTVPAHSNQMDISGPIRAAVDVLGVIHRQLFVRLLNISGSGCLVESQTALDPGTVGTLIVAAEGVEYRDLVRVARCQEIAGSGALHHIGVEFLWEDTPGKSALRRIGTGVLGLAPVNGTRVEFRWPTQR